MDEIIEGNGGAPQPPEDHHVDPIDPRLRGGPGRTGVGDPPSTGGGEQSEDAAQQRLQGLFDHLHTERPDVAVKLEELGSFMGKTDQELGPEDLGRKKILATELVDEAQSDPELAELVQWGVTSVMGNEWADEHFSNVATELPENEGSEEVITPAEERAAFDNLAEANQMLEAVSENPNSVTESALRRKVGDMGNSDVLKKIARSNGYLAKGLYGSWMAFLITFGLFCGLTRVMSKMAGGGGRK